MPEGLQHPDAQQGEIAPAGDGTTDTPRNPLLRPRTTFIFIALLACGAALLVAVNRDSGRSGPLMTFTYSPIKGGHLGIFYSRAFTVAVGTNRTQRVIMLSSATLETQFTNGQTLMNNMVLWNGTESSTNLQKGGTVSVPLHVEGEVVRFRLSFEYGIPAGAVVRFSSRLVGKVPLRRLPAKTVAWLLQHGFMDGIRYEDYVGDWVSKAALVPVPRGTPAQD